MIRHGNWKVGFSGHVFIATNMLAELWAIRQGLILTWDLNYKKVLAETASVEALRLIQNESIQYHPYLAIIIDVREILSREWKCKLVHTLREGKFCVDYLAKKGASQDSKAFPAS